MVGFTIEEFIHGMTAEYQATCQYCARTSGRHPTREEAYLELHAHHCPNQPAVEDWMVGGHPRTGTGGGDRSRHNDPTDT